MKTTTGKAGQLAACDYCGRPFDPRDETCQYDPEGTPGDCVLLHNDGMFCNASCVKAWNALV